MRHFALIGKPLGHSFSKSYFDKKFEVEGIKDCKFTLNVLDDISDLDGFLLENSDLCGFSVTIPYKEKVIPYLTELDESAESIGAVNCVKVSVIDGQKVLKGYNTDAYGFEVSIKPHIKSDYKKALILGTGGASKAVNYILQKLGLETCFVSRTAKEGQLTYSDLTEAVMLENSVIVNTTPLGTFPNVEGCADLPYHLIGGNHLLFDLVYNPSVTTFMQRGLDNGANAINGLNMLQQQAETAWDIWNR